MAFIGGYAFREAWLQSGAPPAVFFTLLSVFLVLMAVAFLTPTKPFDTEDS